ncbi:TonB-dependent receptor [Rhodanobacter sp. C03]|uniref:TonB-dependent receptor n=1 Tax=Rhodanobacter sp. C03 TaxID=1945858 RepID=UPI001C2C4120|nr:TonB-dependent receptor [Rhodanobacter sp. C03]
MPRWLAGLVLCVTSIAHAQPADTPASQPTSDTAPASASSAITLTPVDVIGHYSNGIGTSSAASQGVILGSLLQDIPLLRPGEVLEAIPGMVVTQHSGDGKANQYFLRGYNLDHGTDFASNVDGVPVNMPTNAHGQGYSDLNFLIPELVQQIDYRKGTYFAESGDFSAAGSADILYRNALPSPILNLTLGSFDYRRVLLAGSTPVSLPAWATTDNGNTSAAGPTVLAAVEVLSENGPWRLPEDMHKFNGLARLSDGDAARGWSIDLNAYDAHWDSTDQVPLLLIQSGALCRVCALDTSDGGYSGRDILSGEWHTQDASGYTKVSAYAEHYRLQLFSDFTYFELRPDTGDQFEQAESRNLAGTKVAQGWTGSLFGHDSTTEAGFQLRHDHIDVGLFNTEDRIPFQTVNDNRVNETETAVYLENTTVWSDWFRSQIGIRQDDIHLGLTELNIPHNTGDASGNRTSPKLALVFGPWARTEFFLDAGDGFHSNDARGVIYRVDPTTGGPASPVPPLVAAFGQEIGVRTEIIPGLQSSLSLWRLNSESELVYDADSAVGSTTPNGASRRYGVEWNNHAVINDWLLFDADLAWTHARFSNNNDNGELGDHIPNAVPKVASVGLTVHDVDNWSGDIKLRYIGKYPLSQDNTLVGSSAIVTNLRLAHAFTPSVSLSLDVLNLFDRKYDDIEYEQDYRASLASAPVPDGVTVHPGEPREVRLSLDLKL